MYHYIEDKDFRNRMKSECSDIINQLVMLINSEDLLEVKAYLVGSGSRNLITQNEEEPIDLDYNLEILKQKCETQELKQYVIDCFNKILKRKNWKDCFVQDSKSAITTRKHHIEGYNTQFSIDLAIVKRNDYGLHRLIHHKTGYDILDQWMWNMVRDSYNLDKKVESIKGDDCWGEVRDAYLEKKNMYLTRNDHDHTSFVCYIEAVNEVYNRLNSSRRYNNLSAFFSSPHQPN